MDQFATERDWDQFHSPKNLAMALTVEAAELQECFQWQTEAQSRELDEQQLAAVRDEIADVQCPFLDQDGSAGSPFPIQFRFDDHAPAWPLV